MENLWWLFALLGSIFVALYTYANQLMKLKVPVLMMYRGLWFTIALLFFIFFFKPISNPLFYVYCVLQGLIICYVDTKVFRLVKTFGAEATSIYQPLSIAFIFLFWLMINPSQFLETLSHPVTFILELLALVAIIYSTIKLKNAKASKKVINFIVPIILVFTVNDILNKKCMQAGAENVYSAIYYYNLITSFIISICSYIFYKKSNISYKFFTLKSFKFSVIVISLITALVICKNYSMFYTPNPAYVTAILGVAPIWIVLINSFLLKFNVIKNINRVDIKSMLILIVGIIFMILLANR